MVMIKRFLLVGLLLNLLILPATASTRATTDSVAPGDIIPGEILVLLDEDMDAVTLTASYRDVRALSFAPHTQTARLQVPVGREIAFAHALQRHPGVRMAEPHYRIYAASGPNDPFYDTQQWNLHIIAAEGAWELSKGSPDVVVAIIDSGVDYTHPDLQENLWYNPGESVYDEELTRWVCRNDGEDSDNNGYVDDCVGWDWVEWDNEPLDRFWHGTHVAGVAHATTDNAIGIAGLGWSVRYMNLRVLDHAGFGTVNNLILALDYALKNGAHIVNLSLTLRSSSEILLQAIRRVYAEGLLIVAASGNSGRSVVDYPAAWPETIAVGASTRTDTRAAFSNYGAQLDVVAPGESIFSTNWQTPAYRNASGTSMATPHVSGLAALMLSVRPHLTPEEVRTLLTLSADDVNADTLPGWDPFIGWGRINAQRGVAYALAEGVRVTLVDENQPVRVGGQEVQIQTQITDATGTPLPADGLEVEWAASAGTVEAADTLTDSHGRASAEFHTPTVSGAVHITATIAALNLTGSLTVNVVGGEPITLTLESEKPHVGAGQPLQITASLFDEWENLAASDKTVSFSASAGTFDTSEASAADGTAQVTWTAPPIHGLAFITATVEGLEPASLTIDVWHVQRFSLLLHMATLEDVNR